MNKQNGEGKSYRQASEVISVGLRTEQKNWDRTPKPESETRLKYEKYPSFTNTVRALN